jgi:putative membrane protein
MPCRRQALNERVTHAEPPDSHRTMAAMSNGLTSALLSWAITALSLWAASHIFRGLKFDSTTALVVSALLLGLANAVLKPLLILFTLPLTLLTFGLFVLVINALMILLVAKLVKGFTVSSFWTAFFASIFISILGIALGSFLGDSPEATIRMSPGKGWV